jgi:glycosyltransferase involved in cell wall biosynthesis
LWDEGKQSRLLTQLTAPPLPIFLAGSTTPAGEAEPELGPGKASMRSRRIPSDEEGLDFAARVELRGELCEGEIRELLSRAAIYVATSIYEPFGLAPLEAALSRCAIVANDIPSLHEIWDDAALYFRSNDAASLDRALALLHGNRELRAMYANRAYERARLRYTAARMVGEYMQVYRSLMERRVWAA